MLPSSKGAVAVWLEFSRATVTRSLKKTVADPTWVQSKIEVCSYFNFLVSWLSYIFPLPISYGSL